MGDGTRVHLRHPGTPRRSSAVPPRGARRTPVVSRNLQEAFCASVDQAIEGLAEVGVEEGRSHNRGVPLETISVKIRLVLALVVGISENRSWIIPAGQRAWSRDELVDQLTEFTLYGVRNAPPTIPARANRLVASAL